jgi:Flp pilus assembly protein TadD
MPRYHNVFMENKLLFSALFRSRDELANRTQALCGEQATERRCGRARMHLERGRTGEQAAKYLQHVADNDELRWFA